jgi:hypothetical protein
MRVLQELPSRPRLSLRGAATLRIPSFTVHEMSGIIWSILLKNQGGIADRCQEIQSLRRPRRLNGVTLPLWCSCEIRPWAAILALTLKSCSGKYLPFECLLAGRKPSPVLGPKPSRSRPERNGSVNCCFSTLSLCTMPSCCAEVCKREHQSFLPSS